VLALWSWDESSWFYAAGGIAALGWGAFILRMSATRPRAIGSPRRVTWMFLTLFIANVLAGVLVMIGALFLSGRALIALVAYGGFMWAWGNGWAVLKVAKSERQTRTSRGVTETPLA
jgi:hypothetical protein